MPSSQSNVPLFAGIAILVVIIIIAIFPHSARTPTQSSPLEPAHPLANAVLVTTSSSSNLVFLTTSPLWQRVYEGLLTPQNCFLKRIEYCVVDRNFVDEVIRKYLARYPEYHNKHFTEKELGEFIESVAIDYIQAMRSPEGLRLLEQRVEERYAQPKIVDKGLAVGVDMGIVPGKLSVSIRRDITIGESDHYEKTALRWKSSEWMKLLSDYSLRFSGARYIHVVADLPGLYSQPERFEFIYDRTADRIILFHPSFFSGVYLSSVLRGDFKSYVEGTKRMELYSGLRRERTPLNYTKFDFTTK